SDHESNAPSTSQIAGDYWIAPPARAMTRRGMAYFFSAAGGFFSAAAGAAAAGGPGGGPRGAPGRGPARAGARAPAPAGRSARGGNAGFRGSGRRGGGGSGGFGRRLHLFRVARRRHDGDEGVIELAHDAHVRRQRDLAQMLRVIDLETRDIDVDRFRDVLGRANHLDRVGDGVDGAAALDARRLVRV